MQVTCQRCQAASDRAGLDLVEGGFGFVCDACDHTNVLAPMAAKPAASAPAPEPEAEPAPEPEPRLAPNQTACPKCGNIQRDFYACHRCGLVFANVATGKMTFTTDPLEGRQDAKLLREEWARLRRDLDDVDEHRRFIERCAMSGSLDYAGECYRKLTPPGRPEDARVSEYRKRVLAAAMASVESRERRAEAVATNLRRMIVMLVGAALLLGFAVGYFLLTRAAAPMHING